MSVKAQSLYQVKLAVISKRSLASLQRKQQKNAAISLVERGTSGSCGGNFAVPEILLNNRATWQTDVRAFVNHYSQDLSNVAGLTAELYLWERLWEEKKERAEDIPDKIATTLKVIHPDSFPNIFTILQILATVPATSCSCERSISCLRYLKNYLRSTMGVG